MFKQILNLKKELGTYTAVMFYFFLTEKGHETVTIRTTDLMLEFEIGQKQVKDGMERLKTSNLVQLISYNSGCYTLKITNFLNEVKQPTEPIEAQPANPPKRVSKIAQKQDSAKPAEPMHSELRKVFEDAYFERFQIPFVWSARCGKGLNELIGTLKFTFKEKQKREGLEQSEPNVNDLGNMLKFVISKCPEFHQPKLSPHYLNNQWNAIINEIRTKQQPSNNLGRAGRFAAAKLPVP